MRLEICLRPSKRVSCECCRKAKYSQLVPSESTMLTCVLCQRPTKTSSNRLRTSFFREDLYYRLAGIELQVPPFKASARDDILLLARSVMKEDTKLADDAVAAMIGYKWPGNVRELKQRVQAAEAMSDSKTLTASDLGLSPTLPPSDNNEFREYFDMPLQEAKNLLTTRFDKRQPSSTPSSWSLITSALPLDDSACTAKAWQQKLKQLESGGAKSIMLETIQFFRELHAGYRLTRSRRVFQTKRVTQRHKATEEFAT